MCLAEKPLRCTEASDLKTMSILSLVAPTGCGTLLPQNLPSTFESVV